MTGRLVHTGSVIVDLVMRVGAVPAPGGDTLASSSDLVAGGGLNTIVAARRDGMEVLFAGLHGTGPFGDVVAHGLAASGARVLHRRVVGEDSGYCVVLVDDRAERTFVTHLGAEARAGYAELAAIPLAAGDYVYVSGYSLATDVNARALARWLPELPPDVTVLVDPSPLVSELPRELFDPLLARADILTCNAREAAVLAEGAAPHHTTSRLCSLVRPGAAVLVREGVAGCRVATAGPRGRDGEEVTVPSFRVKALDTNGAGDAHAGVLLSGLARGLTLVRAVRRANAAAAIAVTRPGPTSAPLQEETDALLGA